MILNEIISIVSVVFNSSFSAVVLYPILCLSFLAVIPSVLRHFVFRK